MYKMESILRSYSKSGPTLLTDRINKSRRIILSTPKALVCPSLSASLLPLPLILSTVAFSAGFFFSLYLFLQITVNRNWRGSL